LLDTSVWVDHLRSGISAIGTLLDEQRVVVHPYVMGELACGSMKNRAEVLRDLRRLPRASVAADAEVHRLLEIRRFYGRGIGWVDAHLVTSALLFEYSFVTRDKALSRIAQELRILGEVV
jgi:hypothetical protein